MKMKINLRLVVLLSLAMTSIFAIASHDTSNTTVTVRSHYKCLPIDYTTGTPINQTCNSLDCSGNCYERTAGTYSTKSCQWTVPTDKCNQTTISVHWAVQSCGCMAASGNGNGCGCDSNWVNVGTQTFELPICAS